MTPESFALSGLDCISKNILATNGLSHVFSSNKMPSIKKERGFRRLFSATTKNSGMMKAKVILHQHQRRSNVNSGSGTFGLYTDRFVWSMLSRIVPIPILFSYSSSIMSVRKNAQSQRMGMKRFIGEGYVHRRINTFQRLTSIPFSARTIFIILG